MEPLKPLGPIDTVVFDHDGTLVDSIPVVVAATNGVLLHWGFPPADPDRIVAGMIHTTAKRLGLLAGLQDRQDRLALARMYGPLALKHAALATLYPGIEELLSVLADQGLFQAVVSNSDGAFIRSILTRLGVVSRFRVLVGEDDMPAPKPDPRGLLASLCGSAKNRAVYVGDSSTDLATARAAGIRAIGVTWGTHARAELEPLAFDALVDTPLQLACLV